MINIILQWSTLFYNDQHYSTITNIILQWSTSFYNDQSRKNTERVAQEKFS